MLKTGIHLLRTGRVEANLTHLLDEKPRVPYLGELIAQKQAEGEHAGAQHDDRYVADIERLRAALEDARDVSTLAGVPTAHQALHGFVVRTRLAADSHIA